ITHDSWHKRRKTGGRLKPIHNKRKYELARPPSNTKLGGFRVRTVRTRGGNTKHRALRLDSGNFSWGSEARTAKSRIIDVLYNPSSNELVRNKTLTKNTIVSIDASPFKSIYEAHYGVQLPTKKDTAIIELTDLKLSTKEKDAMEKRRKHCAVDITLREQFVSGRLMACISSRPGQCGRTDGYILEGKELEFYSKKIKAKKGKMK
ncbi:hypothetical protein A3Q56_06819, partial [Intoshia linei]